MQDCNFQEQSLAKVCSMLRTKIIILVGLYYFCFSIDFDAVIHF